MFTNDILVFILLLLLFIFVHDPVSILNGSLNNLLYSIRIIFISMNFETLPDCMFVMLTNILFRKLLTAAEQITI